jgi:nicotinate dehydrogenase subunit B
MGTLSRRKLLKGTGALVVGFSVAGTSRPVAFAADEIPANPNSSADEQLKLSPDLDSWIRMAADGSVTVLTGCVEMGTGILTALSQIVAEELDVPIDRVSLISADTDVVPNQGITAATTTIGSSANATKRAAAMARQVLLGLASQELCADIHALEVRDGVVRVKDDPAVQISFGALIGGRQFGQIVDVDVPVKPPAEYRIVGRSVPRIDIPQKLTAAVGDFQENVRLPGMQFARTLRAPTYGAKLKTYDLAVAAMPGVVVLPFRYPGDERLDRVERLDTMPGDFLAVVAEREDQALRAVEQLRASVEWESGNELPATSADLNDWLVAHGKESDRQKDHARREDKYQSRRELAQAIVSATYRIPYQAYAPISPAWALADVQGDRATVWSATQWPFGARWMVAQALGFARDDQVHLISGSSSGLYGRRNYYDQEVDVEAALISQAIGSPVRLQWSRQDEFIWSPYRPPQIVSLEAALTEAGQIDGLQARVWTASRGIHPRGPTEGFADAPYDLGPRSMTAYDAGPLLRTGWMRNAARGNNIFALESLVDEVAARVKEDPVAFRLKHLRDPRAIDVITAAAQKAGWQDHIGSTGRGMGISFAHRGGDESPAFSHVAYVAEVEVDQETGEFRVQKMTCAIDCGLVINPNGVTNQVEGGVIHALSWALKEQVTFDEKIVTSHDWVTYPILTFPDVPEIDVVMLDRQDQPAKGIAEQVTVPVAAAVANAIYDATGARVRDLPMTPEQVKSALANT